MKISIIGSGWLAKPLAKDLMADGHCLSITSTQTEKVATLKDQSIPCVKYALGESIVKNADFFQTDVLIIAITSKDIDVFEQFIAQINPQNTQHIIFISSTSVYTNSEIPHDESSQNLNQDNPLLTIEAIINKHPKASIIRFAGLVGPKRHPGRFFSRDKTIKNPQAPVNLIHLDDCIGLITTVIEKQAWGEVFNGCADNHPAKGEFYPLMAQSLGLPLPKLASSNNHLSNKIIDNTKIKKQLNYTLKYPDVFNMLF